VDCILLCVGRTNPRFPHQRTLHRRYGNLPFKIEERRESERASERELSRKLISFLFLLILLQYQMLPGINAYVRTLVQKILSTDQVRDPKVRKAD
jgi:hypothetical protein